MEDEPTPTDTFDSSSQKATMTEEPEFDAVMVNA
jgi:hypothetical protein